MIAARLFQARDQNRALELYCDVIATALPLDELKNLETVRKHHFVNYYLFHFLRSETVVGQHTICDYFFPVADEIDSKGYQ